MKNRHLSFLLSAEPEALGGNGPSTPTEAAPETAAAETSAEAPAAHGFLQSVLASVQSKASLLSQVQTLTADNALLTADNATLTAENATLTAELTALRAERSQIAEALEAARLGNATAELQAAQQVAALGFEAASLPAPDASEPETAESLLAQLNAETDNDKRFALAAKINALN